jgi:hypothetical protein
MNERIRELELEAIAYADSKVPANNRYNDIYHSIVRGRFAELIVRECVDICMKNQYEGTPLYNNGSVSSAEFIKEHFGVEE